jgi:hypothetical protein
MYPLCRALEKAGLYELTHTLWEPYFKAIDYHMTTLPETPEPTRSDCHAWSSLPLYEFTRCWLGVQSAAPGWKAITIAPLPCDLHELSGTLPTPQGDIFVTWKIVDGIYHLSARTPAVPVTVRLPDGREAFFPEGGNISM